MLFMMKAHPRSKPRFAGLWLPAALVLAAVSTPAAAQLRLPGLPGVSSVPELTRRLPQSSNVDTVLASTPLDDVRRVTVRGLLQRHRDVLEADPNGEPVVRGELLVSAPSDRLLAAATAEGFRVLRTQPLEGLDERFVVLAPPRRLSLPEAAARLRALEPGTEVDFNHVYTRSGSGGDGASSGPTARTGGTDPAGAADAAAPRRVGLIDGGVDRQHPSLAQALVTTWGCNGQVLPSNHGTAVASLLIGQGSGYSGAAGTATLYAADIYCDGPTGGSSEQLVQALAWLAREKVAVINVSLVGPANRLLERALRALLARGHLVVAAVGNDGPAAAPLFPAAYAGVLGVTGVGSGGRVLPEAAQGPQVAFAAPGADLPVARARARDFAVARGTSFAAPVVAGLLARALRAPDVLAAARAVAELQQSAKDLGAPGRDDVYGWGLLDWPGRVAPAHLQARKALAP